MGSRSNGKKLQKVKAEVFEKTPLPPKLPYRKILNSNSRNVKVVDLVSDNESSDGFEGSPNSVLYSTRIKKAENDVHRFRFPSGGQVNNKEIKGGKHVQSSNLVIDNELYDFEGFSNGVTCSNNTNNVASRSPSAGPVNKKEINGRKNVRSSNLVSDNEWYDFEESPNSVTCSKNTNNVASSSPSAGPMNEKEIKELKIDDESSYSIKGVRKRSIYSNNPKKARSRHRSAGQGKTKNIKGRKNVQSNEICQAKAIERTNASNGHNKSPTWMRQLAQRKQPAALKREVQNLCGVVSRVESSESEDSSSPKLPPVVIKNFSGCLPNPQNNQSSSTFGLIDAGKKDRTRSNPNGKNLNFNQGASNRRQELENKKGIKSQEESSSTFELKDSSKKGNTRSNSYRKILKFYQEASSNRRQELGNEKGIKSQTENIENNNSVPTKLKKTQTNNELQINGFKTAHALLSNSEYKQQASPTNPQRSQSAKDVIYQEKNITYDVAENLASASNNLLENKNSEILEYYENQQSKSQNVWKASWEYEYDYVPLYSIPKLPNEQCTKSLAKEIEKKCSDLLYSNDSLMYDTRKNIEFPNNIEDRIRDEIQNDNLANSNIMKDEPRKINQVENRVKSRLERGSKLKELNLSPPTKNIRNNEKVPQTDFIKIVADKQQVPTRSLPNSHSHCENSTSFKTLRTLDQHNKTQDATHINCNVIKVKPVFLKRKLGLQNKEAAENPCKDQHCNEQLKLLEDIGKVLYQQEKKNISNSSPDLSLSELDSKNSTSNYPFYNKDTREAMLNKLNPSRSSFENRSLTLIPIDHQSLSSVHEDPSVSSTQSERPKLSHNSNSLFAVPQKRSEQQAERSPIPQKEAKAEVVQNENRVDLETELPDDLKDLELDEMLFPEINSNEPIEQFQERYLRGFESESFDRHCFD